MTIFKIADKPTEVRKGDRVSYGIDSGKVMAVGFIAGVYTATVRTVLGERENVPVKYIKKLDK